MVKFVFVLVGKSEFFVVQYKVVICNLVGDIAVVVSVIGLICIMFSKEWFELLIVVGEIVVDIVQEYIVVEIYVICRIVGVICM